MPHMTAYPAVKQMSSRFLDHGTHVAFGFCVACVGLDLQSPLFYVWFWSLT